jgi:hypothetical protein
MSFETLFGPPGAVSCLLAGVLAAAPGCSSDDGIENVLPMPASSTTTADTGDVTDGEFELPRAYRFDCVDIQGIGDADGSVLQATVLENAWTNDINNYKLNIIMTVTEREEGAGTATVGIGSGVGTQPSDLCNEAGSVTDPYVIGYDPDVAVWTRSADASTCSTMAVPGDPHGGSYGIDLGPDDLVNVYAEDDDGTHFNCTPDPGTPNAVPIRALYAEVTANEAGSVLAGVLTGCLVEAEAESLCSCIGACTGDGPDDLQTEGTCAGCPRGSNPLRGLLGNIGSSERCTGIMGEPAFDLQIGFTAVALPSVPQTCGA